MKRASVFCVLLMMASIAQASPVGVYVDDDFSGSSLDSATWTSWANSGASVGVSSSRANIDSTGWDNSAAIRSIAAVTPDPGQTVVLSSIGIATEEWSTWGYWGLTGGDNAIQLFRGGSEDNFWTYVDISTSSTHSRFAIEQFSNAFNGDYQLTWSSAGVQVSKAGTLLFDSAINAPTWGDASWTIPTDSLRLQIGAMGGGGISVDSVMLQVVPEPMTMILLATGGLAAFRRRIA